MAYVQVGPMIPAREFSDVIGGELDNFKHEVFTFKKCLYNAACRHRQD
jgi:hypothetical protein